MYSETGAGKSSDMKSAGVKADELCFPPEEWKTVFRPRFYTRPACFAARKNRPSVIAAWLPNISPPTGEVSKLFIFKKEGTLDLLSLPFRTQYR